MRKLALVVSALLFALPLWAQAQNPVTNGGFEQWGADGVPADWSIMGDVTMSNDAHSGQHSVLMKTTFLDRETGLNRGWQPDSGQQGTMLTQLKGGLRFWYKVPDASNDASLHFYIIAMSKRPMEDTGDPRADFAVPAAHYGDGKWHEGVLAYDFSGNAAAKWVHLSPRIFGSHASLLLDDVEWLERVGPVLSINRLRWEEDPAHRGERATLAVGVKNNGDGPTTAAALKITAPPSLRVTGSPTLPVLAPDDTAEVSVVIEGRRDHAGVIGVAVALPPGNGEPPATEFRLEPKMDLVQLRPEHFILAPGEETVVEAVVRGDGTAISTGLTGKLTVGGALQVVGGPQKLVEVAPGAEATVSWRVKALRQAPLADLSAVVTSANSGDGKVATTLVIGGARKIAPDEPGAHVSGDTAWLQGEGLRLVVHRSEFGFGLAALQVKKAAWETVAQLPSAGRIVVRTADGKDQVLPLYGDARVAGGKLIIASTAKDADGAQWDATLTLALRDDGRNLGVTAGVRCDRPRRLLAFDGPMLYVGAGSFGSAKDEALFPGLEWLDKNEESSNWQVIKRGHPHQIRYVPHPNMITIPLMSVYHDGTTVGLLWNCRQQWDGDHDRPAAAFASPDRFEGRNAHLMGLFVPSVGEEGKPWVKMNDRTASVPYELPAGRALTLEGVVYARTDTHDALSAMDEWFRIYGVPQPRSYPRGTPAGEVAFSMRAYLESLWVPETRMWWTSRGAGKLLSPQGRPMSFAHDLLQGALMVDDPALAEKCRARAQEVVQLEHGTPAYADLGLDYGGADHWLIGTAAQVPMIVAAQGADGAWRFDANLKAGGVFKGYDYHRLGPDRAAELGTCANKATTLLRFARLTGSTEAYDAGVKALRFMDRFRVPRAAQVWEVMVQAPDILAAAEAVEACLEAYQYDHRPEWLDQARRWARGGLPFVYMWNDPEKPYLLGASIPVFGASCETGSWFGRPVQWNGLRHAQAILKLARYDHSMPWEQIARMITVSGMYQQSTKDDEIALWPDSISAIAGDKAGWIFAPLQILEQLYTLVGRGQDPKTVILGTLPDRIHLSSVAEITEARWERETIAAKLTYPRRESGYSVLVNLSRPAAVLLDGKPLAERPDLEGGDAAGWRYLTSYAICLVRATSDGPHTLEIRGARYHRTDLTPELRTSLKFDFNESTEGWLPANSIGELSVKDGALQLPITGGDPYLTRSAMSVDGSTVREIVVRMRIPAGPAPQSGQFYWGTQEAPFFSEDRVVVFPVTTDGQWHEYRIAVGTHPQWSGHRIASIRLDPFQSGEPVTVEVDSLRGE